MTTEHDGFWVMGVSARTRNEREMGPGGVIPGIWERFRDGTLAATIPGRVGGAMVAVYTDYESDAGGEYTFMVGAPVQEGAIAPEGMVVAHVPRGKYWRLAVEPGPVWETIPAAWGRVWKESPARAFQTDFEWHMPDGSVEIWVGLR
jgi:predicted transcriptional regulator YdeE